MTVLLIETGWDCPLAISEAEEWKVYSPQNWNAKKKSVRFRGLDTWQDQNRSATLLVRGLSASEAVQRTELAVVEVSDAFQRPPGTPEQWRICTHVSRSIQLYATCRSTNTLYF